MDQCAGVTVTPSRATLGAVLTGARLAALDDAEWRVIEAAFHEHAVLIFPGQHLTDAEQMAFGRRFGPLAIDSLPFSNERDDGSLRPAADPLMRLLRGNEGWHTDSSFQPVPAKASILSARKVPSAGGETEWADMRAAFDALDAETRARLEGLAAYHSLYHSQASIGEAGETTAQGLATLHAGDRDAGADRAGYREAAVPPLRPLVKVHPVTQRPALYIGRHAYGIPGLSAQESAELLAGLVEHACRAPRVLAHRWRCGDVAIWDNRCVLHRARAWELTEPRVMHHTRVAGDPATESALDAAAAARLR